MKTPELKELAINWMRRELAPCLIVGELSVADWGGASIDLAAVMQDRIVGVEIKGQGDSPSRLPLQGCMYSRVAEEMWLLPSPLIEDKCRANRPRYWGTLEVREGIVRPRNKRTIFVTEKMDDGSRVSRHQEDPDNYEPTSAGRSPYLCAMSMLESLWKEELRAIASRYNLTNLRSFSTDPLRDMILDALPVPVIHREMVRALNERQWINKSHQLVDLRAA